MSFFVCFADVKTLNMQASDHSQRFQSWPSNSSRRGQPRGAMATDIWDHSRRQRIIRSVCTFVRRHHRRMSRTQEKWFSPQRHGQPKDYRWSAEQWIRVVMSGARAALHPGILFTSGVLPGRQKEPRGLHSHGVHETGRWVESRWGTLTRCFYVRLAKRIP